MKKIYVMYALTPIIACAISFALTLVLINVVLANDKCSGQAYQNHPGLVEECLHVQGLNDPYPAPGGEPYPAPVTPLPTSPGVPVATPIYATPSSPPPQLDPDCYNFMAGDCSTIGGSYAEK